MKTPQERLDDLQFIHSMWLNEVSHAEVELTLFTHRLNLHGANLQTVPESEAIALIQVEIEQILMAIAYIKKGYSEVTGHRNPMVEVLLFQNHATCCS